MPLYTYVISYGGRLHVTQDSRSNFKGFAALLMDSQAGKSLGGMSEAIRNEATESLHRADWSAIEGAAGVWRTSFTLQGTPFDVIATDTRR